MKLSPPPPNALGFTISTTPAIRQAYRSQTYRYNNYQAPKEDSEWWKEQQRDYAATKIEERDEEQKIMEIGSDAWLIEQLGEDLFCRHCASTLALQFNTARSGWMVHCYHCGMQGPTERCRDEAVTAFSTIIAPQ